MEALGTLTGGIAHDFNNILAAIIGFTEVVRDRFAEGDRDRRHLDRVLEAGLRGRELIKRMLAFSRKTEQEKKPVLLGSIVTETVRFVRSSTPATISIRTNVRTGSGMVFADPVQMQQVVLNLCTNAVQAMWEKGGVLDAEVSGRTVDESEGVRRGMKPGPYVILAVRDTGVGISPSIVDRIFDPFFTTKKVGEGTGLGLSVVHGIVQQHEGYVFAESEAGLGSTFTVYLPMVEAEVSGENLAEQPIPSGTERVLFVDDEELLAEMGRDMLEDLGYQVTVTTSSAEALALFRTDPGRFDLVITDVTMPEITGVELAREMLAARGDIPIIMCTGFSHLVDAGAAKASGVRAFTMKPLTKREIAKTIRVVLDGQPAA
jgi:CheY-like chemotaxis protein